MATKPESDREREQQRLQQVILIFSFEFGASLGAKKWAEAEKIALEIVNVKLKADDKIGLTKITDLKEEMNYLEEYRKKFVDLYAPCDKIEARLLKIYEDLHKNYGLPKKELSVRPAKMDPNGDTEKLKQLKQQEKYYLNKKEKGEADGHKMPKTTAALERTREVIKKLEAASQPQPKQEPGTSMNQASAALKTSTAPAGGNNAANVVKVTNVEVVRSGQQLIIPDNLDINDAIKLLQARAAYEEEVATINEQFDVFPWDGAIALGRVLKSIFGWVPQQGASIQVDSGVNEKVSVPWGKFQVPGIDAVMVTGAPWKDGRVTFQVTAYVKHKFENAVKDIIAQVREEVRSNSIYRGKAIKVRFLDDQGEKLPLPEPKFIDVMNINENMVAYAKPVAEAIETNLFTPIRRIKELEQNGLHIRRSVMLGGVYGTGKTLAAGVAAKLAVKQGMTYIYVARADELTHALAFSRPYQDPAVMLFCEDLDRVMSGDRSVAIDDILNTIDGVDSKNDRRMLVFTTNDIDSIEPAMIRPGRLDAVIEVTPPDAAAAWKLVQIYAGHTLASDVDGEAVGNALSNQIPAVIAEVVKRAKLTQLKLTPVGQLVSGIGTQALLEAAQTMKHQLELLNRSEETVTPLENAVATLGAALVNGEALQLPIKRVA